MIKEITMFTVICDNCGADSNDGNEYSCYGDSGYAHECAMDSNWISEGDKDYCPDCFTYDDDDNLVINEDRKKK